MAPADSGLDASSPTSSTLDESFDSPRSAMEALRSSLEQLDFKTTPRFPDQASETKESDQFAISLYVKVAEVHKHEVIPFIPRIMSSVVRSLASSGGSQQLQQACAKVVTSVARYAIDPSRSPPSNEDVLRSLCSPLLPGLSSKLDPLAVGAAICLQALVESEKWKCAPFDLQDLLCAKATAAFAEPDARSVAHMHLMRSLAKFNSSVVQPYGGQLIKVAVDILQGSQGTSDSWQQRVAAAQLLSAVLKIADKDTLHFDLSSTVRILEGCRADKVAAVRAAVLDALATAKMLVSETALRLKISPVDNVPEGRKLSETDKADVPEFHVLSDTLSPDSGTPSHGTVFNATPSTVNSGVRPKRSPLFPVKQSLAYHTFTSRRTPGSSRSSKCKENAPAVKPREILSETPASSRLHSDDSPVAHLSKELAPTNESCNPLKSRGVDSSVLRSSFSKAKIEDEDALTQNLCDKVFGNDDGGIEKQCHIAITRRSTIEHEGGESCQFSVNSNGNHDLVNESKGDVTNRMGWSNETSSPEENGNDGIFVERDDYRDGNAGRNWSTEDVLCNGCTDTPATQRTGKCEKMVSSETGAHVQMTEDLLLLSTPRRLESTLQSLNLPPKLIGTGAMSFKDCIDLNADPSRGNEISENCGEDHHDDNLKVNASSQRNTENASSSCFSLGEWDSSTGRNAKEAIQSEGPNPKIDHNCLSVLFQSLDEQASVLSSGKVSNEGNEESEYPKIFNAQHTRLSVKLELKPDRSEHAVETVWSSLLKAMNAKSFIGKFSSSIVFAIVVLCTAIAIFRSSRPQDLHVLVPT